MSNVTFQIRYWLKLLCSAGVQHPQDSLILKCQHFFLLQNCFTTEMGLKYYFLIGNHTNQNIFDDMTKLWKKYFTTEETHSFSLSQTGPTLCDSVDWLPACFDCSHTFSHVSLILLYIWSHIIKWLWHNWNCCSVVKYLVTVGRWWLKVPLHMALFTVGTWYNCREWNILISQCVYFVIIRNYLDNIRHSDFNQIFFFSCVIYYARVVFFFKNVLP